MTPQQIWQAVLSELELTLSKANFITWFKNTFVGEYENGRVVICVPSIFYQTWLEKKFHHALIKLIEKASGDQVQSLTYRVEAFNPQKAVAPLVAVIEKTANFSPNLQILVQPVPLSINSSGLNHKHVFANFIVGRGTELAHAAAQAVAQRPGLAYNPLFIYGGVGLGKTHLVQAVGNEVLAKDSAKRVLYVSSETFTNEYISAVRGGKGREFKDHYRNVDVLIIDDIQFISGKEGTQEELFHTFNALHPLNKQVIVSSDRPPKAIPMLEPRLLSRFEWGLIVDVSSPDLETRLAILEAKCQEKSQSLSKATLQLVASLVQNNVRELEGALNKIIAYRNLKQTEPTLEVVKNLLSNLEAAATSRMVTIKQLIETVAGFFDVKLEDLLSARREKRLSYPRQVIAFLLREELGTSFPTIGRELGGRDHTTAIHSYEKIKKLVAENGRCLEEINQVKQKIYAK